MRGCVGRGCGSILLWLVTKEDVGKFYEIMWMV